MSKDYFSQFWRICFSCVLIAGLFCGANLRAQDADEEFEEEEGEAAAAPAEVPWEESEEKRQIDEQIKQWKDEAMKQFRAEFSPAKTVDLVKSLVQRRVERKRYKTNQRYIFRLLRAPGREVDWEGYNQKAGTPLNVIIDDVYESAKEQALEEIAPEERKKRIEEEAEEKFQGYKVGQRVAFLQLRGSRGANAYIENKLLRAINEERIMIGNRYVIREDLSEEDQAKFYPDVRERLKKNYIESNKRKIDAEVASRISELCYQNTPVKFLEENYIPDITKPTASLRSAKPEYWIAKKTFIDRFSSELVRQRYDVWMANEFPNKCREAGWMLMPTKDGKGEEWVTAAEKQRREAPATPAAGNNPPPM